MKNQHENVLYLQAYDQCKTREVFKPNEKGYSRDYSRHDPQ